MILPSQNVKNNCNVYLLRTFAIVISGKTQTEDRFAISSKSDRQAPKSADCDLFANV